MTDYVTSILADQYEAGLCMLRDCVIRCPDEHWDSKVGHDAFRQVAYHTLYFTDLYLSPTENDFQRHEHVQKGGDELSKHTPSEGLSKKDAHAYVIFCRQKLTASLKAESSDSLQGPSGFSWLPFSRGELHVYNIRHLQHHVGQLSASLRRVLKFEDGWWVRSGWRK